MNSLSFTIIHRKFWFFYLDLKYCSSSLSVMGFSFLIYKMQYQPISLYVSPLCKTLLVLFMVVTLTLTS